ncbi:MAG: restriction endonuclease [Candidatus Bathyarchaeia archaeon]
MKSPFAPFDIESTNSEDFFQALLPLIPRAIEVGHACYEQVLIKDGRIEEGEYDKAKGLEGLYVSSMEISDDSAGFSLKGRAFASTPIVKDLENTLLNLRDYLLTLGVYDPKPCKGHHDLFCSLVIETMFFMPGSFRINLVVRKLHDETYEGSVGVSYETLVNDIIEAKSHLTESKRIRDQTYEEMLKKVKDAETTDEKKKTLESFANILFTDAGFEVKYISKRGIDSEVDLFVINESKDNFKMQLGNPIIVECKNISEPATSSIIRNFQTKLMDKAAFTGVLFSLKGITGSNDAQNAKAAIRTSLIARNTRIIVIDGNDLEKVAQGESFLSVLREKFYELSTI